MVLVAPRSARPVDVYGARPTLLTGYFFCLLGFVAMLVRSDEPLPDSQLPPNAPSTFNRKLRRYPSVPATAREADPVVGPHVQ